MKKILNTLGLPLTVLIILQIVLGLVHNYIDFVPFIGSLVSSIPFMNGSSRGYLLYFVFVVTFLLSILLIVIGGIIYLKPGIGKSLKKHRKFGEKLLLRGVIGILLTITLYHSLAIINTLFYSSSFQPQYLKIK